jgi:predicted transcriptional regulator
MFFESKRSESDIVHNILVETRTGAKKTQLVYNAKMSHTQLNKYLDRLIEQDFIQEKKDNGNTTLYYLTEKGEKMDAILKQAISLIGEG